MDQALIESVRVGDLKALARAITLVEQGSLPGLPRGSQPIVGITGPPGAGKSTLISSMIEVLRARGETVAVLAIDPSSPITGGALLGDRVRMQGHVDDSGVYVRSMATRGHLGGLAIAAADALSLMALAGFDRVIVETVGVGQSEVEVMGVADTVVLVLAPGWGDQVQAEKAGVVEIADIVVINKADRSGVAAVKRALTEATGGRDVEIVATTATTGDGVVQLIDALDARCPPVCGGTDGP